MCGSGITMKHSSSVSDAAFHDLVEHPVLWKESLEAHGIQLHVKFRDDTLDALSSPRMCPKFEQRLASLAYPFCAIENECFSLVGTAMLDLMIFKVLRLDRITRPRCRPHINPLRATSR